MPPLYSPLSLPSFNNHIFLLPPVQLARGEEEEKRNVKTKCNNHNHNKNATFRDNFSPMCATNCEISGASHGAEKHISCHGTTESYTAQASGHREQYSEVLQDNTERQNTWGGWEMRHVYMASKVRHLPGLLSLLGKWKHYIFSVYIYSSARDINAVVRVRLEDRV